MILVISVCNDSFHYFEFVRPIEDIINDAGQNFISINYKEITQDILKKIDKIIICGTSLKDNAFLEDIKCFDWIKECNKPLLGICAGMHIISLVHNGKLKNIQEIGLTQIEFLKDFFEIKDTIEVYELHNFYVESKEFEIIAKSKQCPQVIANKKMPHYAVLFHPEVRNKAIIKNFIKNS